MFNWLGWKRGLPLWWSYRLNKRWKRDIGETFEGIAETRRQLLNDWAADCWFHLERLLERARVASVGEQAEEIGVQSKDWERALDATYARAIDFTELFVLDAVGSVICSTHSGHVGKVYTRETSLGAGLAYAKGEGGIPRKCLFGPYPDSLTEALGPRSSAFHDKMTLMFIMPLAPAGQWQGAVCGRVPNDVLGDLIQRESGHVYPDSGDNYLFMAKPSLQSHIAPGTALSRSRFEDRTFTQGENLKDGVTTDWGTVTVREHTELELMFTDPATGELHPGVANTIRNGSNLFVEFPGYSDYRHIPVIGKGVTFRLPHCPDEWGMMCEGDLEEVYRIRSISLRMGVPLLAVLGTSACLSAILVYAMSDALTSGAMAAVMLAFQLLVAGVSGWMAYRRSDRRIVEPLRQISRFIRMNAEGKGDLTKRLTLDKFEQDETGELAKWINNMIDSLEGIMLQVKLATGDVAASQRLLQQSSSAAGDSTERMGGKIGDMIVSLRRQLKDIDIAKEAAAEMRGTLRMLEDQAAQQIAVAQGEIGRIGEQMERISRTAARTNESLQIFMDTANEIQHVLQAIREISAQTQLLALNASIEAARVGEHGRGFSVVAAEIRKLAELTRRSTEKVHNIVASIYDQAQEAQRAMLEGTRAVGEGSGLVAAASETLGEAQAGDPLRARVVDEVVRLMEQVAAISMENRAISTEVEGNVRRLIADIEGVGHTSHHTAGITALLLQTVAQFRVTETRKR